MKKLLLLSTVLTALIMTSCSEKQGDVSLNFKAEYDGQPLVMLDVLDYPSGGKFFVSRISYFLSDVKLGDEVLAETEYVDLSVSHSDLEKAKQGYSLSYKDVEARTYDTFSMSIGVNAENNAKSPGDFTSDNALSRQGEYWQAWGSYVFYKIEGMYDADGDGQYEQGVSLHVGGDEVFNNLKVGPVTVSGDVETEINIVLDLKDVFNKDGVIYDINQFPNLHNKSKHLDQMRVIMNNTLDAIKLEK